MADDGHEESLLRYGGDDEFKPGEWKALQKDINAYLEVLEARPRIIADLSAVRFEGQVYKTKSRKPQWQEVFATLSGDNMTFTTLAGKSKGAVQIAYVFTTRVMKEDDLIIKTGVSIKQRIILITSEDVLQIASDSEEQTKAWLDVLRKLLKAKYSKQELNEKEEAKKDLQPLLLEQEKLKVKKFQLILKTLADSGFFIEPKLKKEKEGYIELKRKGKEWKKLYLVLFKDYIYLFKPHEKVKLDSQPYDWMDVSQVTSVRPSKKKNNFVVRTVLRRFVMRAKHDIAVSEWINALRSLVEKKSNVTISKLAVEADDKGYFYTKPIDERLSLMWIFEGKNKQKKFPKGKEHTIGRSSSCAVTLTDDKHISRAHCRIVIENNIPYVVDMGASSGTKLNGEKITKHPLKPNDVIEIGKSKLIFEVKDGELIFSGAPINASAAYSASSGTGSRGSSPMKFAGKKEKPMTADEGHVLLEDSN